MKIQYRKLEIWKLSYDFVIDIYHALEKIPEYENNNIKSQLRRASTSLPLNVAEGSGSGSPRVFMTHLIYAYRSGCEVETLLMLCRDIKFISQEEYDKLFQQLDMFMRKLCSYMDYVDREYIKNDKRYKHPFYKEELSAIKTTSNSLVSVN